MKVSQAAITVSEDRLSLVALIAETAWPSPDLLHRTRPLRKPQIETGENSSSAIQNRRRWLSGLTAELWDTELEYHTHLRIPEEHLKQPAAGNEESWTQRLTIHRVPELCLLQQLWAGLAWL